MRQAPTKSSCHGRRLQCSRGWPPKARLACEYQKGGYLQEQAPIPKVREDGSHQHRGVLRRGVNRRSKWRGLETNVRQPTIFLAVGSSDLSVHVNPNHALAVPRGHSATIPTKLTKSRSIRPGIPKKTSGHCSRRTHTWPMVSTFSGTIHIEQPSSNILSPTTSTVRDDGRGQAPRASQTACSRASLLYSVHSKFRAVSLISNCIDVDQSTNPSRTRLRRYGC